MITMTAAVGRRANCDRRPVSFEGIDQGCLGRLT